MSEDLLSTVLTAAIVTSIILWPFVLERVCPPCTRVLQRCRSRMPPSKE